MLFKKNSILDIGTRIVNETCGEVQGSGIRRIWSELVHQFLELCHIVSNGRRLLDMEQLMDEKLVLIPIKVIMLETIKGRPTDMMHLQLQQLQLAGS